MDSLTMRHQNEKPPRKKIMNLEQQIKAFGCGHFAVELNSKAGHKKLAVCTVPTNVKVQVMIQVMGKELGVDVCKTYKVKGDGIKLIGTQVPNEAFKEVWDVLVQFPKGQVETN